MINLIENLPTKFTTPGSTVITIGSVDFGPMKGNPKEYMYGTPVPLATSEISSSEPGTKPVRNLRSRIASMLRRQNNGVRL